MKSGQMNRRAGWLGKVLVGAVLVGSIAALPVLPAHADTEIEMFSSTAAREPVSMKVPVRMVRGPQATGQNGMVVIRLGNSAPIPVIIDTGFTGLVLFPGAPRPAGLTNEAMTIPAPDGSKTKGLAGQATLTINGVRSVVPVPFLYTNSDSNFFKIWGRTGARGLLGIGTVGSAEMVNPLSTLPGQFGLRWSVHFSRDTSGNGGQNGSLVLGAQPPVTPAMVFQMPNGGKDVNGSPLWNDLAIIGCWKFGATAEQCVPTVFDAAFTTMRPEGSVFKRVPLDSLKRVRTGTRVTLAAPGNAYTGHAFKAGREASRNLVRVISKGQAAVNSGNSFFFDYTVSYDLITGRIYFSNPARKTG